MNVNRIICLLLCLLLAAVPASAGTKIKYGIKNETDDLLSAEGKSDLQIYQDQLTAWTQIIGNYQWSYADGNMPVDREIITNIENSSDKVEEAYWILALMREKDRYYGDLPAEEEFYARQENVYASAETAVLAEFALEPSLLDGLSSRSLTAEELSVTGDYDGGVYYSEIIDERYVLVALSHTMDVSEWDVHVKKQEFHQLVELYIQNGHNYAVCISDHHRGEWYGNSCGYDLDALRDRLEEKFGFQEKYPDAMRAPRYNDYALTEGEPYFYGTGFVTSLYAEEGNVFAAAMDAVYEYCMEEYRDGSMSASETQEALKAAWKACMEEHGIDIIVMSEGEYTGDMPPHSFAIRNDTELYEWYLNDPVQLYFQLTNINNTSYSEFYALYEAAQAEKAGETSLGGETYLSGEGEDIASVGGDVSWGYADAPDGPYWLGDSGIRLCDEAVAPAMTSEYERCMVDYRAGNATAQETLAELTTVWERCIDSFDIDIIVLPSGAYMKDELGNSLVICEGSHLHAAYINNPAEVYAILTSREFNVNDYHLELDTLIEAAQAEMAGETSLGGETEESDSVGESALAVQDTFARADELTAQMYSMYEQFREGAPSQFQVPADKVEAVDAYIQNAEALSSEMDLFDNLRKAYVDNADFEQYCKLLWYIRLVQMEYSSGQAMIEAGAYSGELMDENSFNAMITEVEAEANALFPEASAVLEERMNAYLAGEAVHVEELAGEDAELPEDEIMVEAYTYDAEAVSAPSYEEIEHLFSDSPESAGDVSRTETMENSCFTIEDGVITHVTYVPVDRGDDFIALVMPDTGATEIGEYAFSDINQNPDWGSGDIDAAQIPLSHFYIADGIERIAANAFTHQNMLYLHLPDTVTQIDAGAFSACNYLSAVEIPSGVSRLNEGTFYRCPNLSYVLIPENVTYIDDGFLLDCNPDVIIYGYAGSAAEDYAKRLGLTFVEIGSGEVIVPVITPEPDITPRPPEFTPGPDNTPDLTAVPEVEETPEPILEPTVGIPEPPSMNDMIYNQPVEDYRNHDENPWRAEETGQEDRRNNDFEKLWEKVVEKLEDIPGFQKYSDAIFNSILRMDEETRRVFEDVLNDCDFKEKSLIPERNVPCSYGTKVIFNFAEYAQSQEVRTLNRYRRTHGGHNPTEEELAKAVEEEVLFALFHEMGHVADRGFLRRYGRAGDTETMDDDSATNAIHVDAAQYLYEELLEITDPDTAGKIVNATIRENCIPGAEQNAELTIGEEMIRDAAFESLLDEANERYFESMAILDAFSGTLYDYNAGDRISPRGSRGDYYSDDRQAASEAFASTFSIKMMSIDGRMEAVDEYAPGFTEYFNERWEELCEKAE